MLKKIEERLEFADLIQTYHLEDDLYDPAKRKRPIFGFSRIEGRLPRLFIILYWLALLGVIISQYQQIVTQFATWGVTLPKP